MGLNIHTIPLGFDYCYIIQDKGMIMVDGGYPKKEKEFSKALEKLKIDPQDIMLMIMTHAHWDHIGSVKGIKDLTGAKIALHINEKEWLEKSLKPMPPGVTLWGHIFGGITKAFLPLVHIPPTEVDLAIDDNGLSLSEYGIPGKVLYTPGHSSGSVSILLETGDAFVGDLAMNKFPLRLTPGLPIFAEDWPALKKSWQLLLEEGARRIYPAHGKPFPVEIIQKALF